MLPRLIILLLLIFPFALPVSAQLTLEFDINQEPAGSTPAQLLEYDGQIYLRANDGTHGTELWTYDLLTEEASLVADIRPFEESSVPNWLTEMDGRIYFSADDGNSGDELWVHIPAQDTTYQVADINPGEADGQIIYPMPYQGQLYFGAEANPDTGLELYRFNPATGQITLVADIDPDGSSWPSFLTVFDDRLFFEADDGSTGTELWVYDGAADTVGLVEEINIGPSNSNVAFLTVVEDRLYFRGNNGSTGDEVYAYDPALDEILPLPEINLILAANPNQFAAAHGALYLSALSDDGTGQELWTYRPQADTMFMVADINPGPGNAVPTSITEFNGGVLLAADNGTLGRETYFYNPDTEDISLLFEVQPGPTGSQPFSHIPIGDQVYFSAFRSDVNQELWRYDLTAGLELAADINPTNSSSNPSFFTGYAGRLFFQAAQGQTGAEVWVHDPHSNTTELLEDLQPGTSGSEPSSFAVLDNRLYFGAAFPGVGNELVVYDTLTDDIALIADINPGPTGAQISYLTALDSALYFRADDGIHGAELWVYDPVSDQTSLLADLNPNGSSDPADLVALDGKLYFVAQEATYGREVYQYNPDTQQLQVIDIMPGATAADPDDLTPCSGRVFFHATDPVEGPTLHSYDPVSGTPTAHLVGGISPIPAEFLTAFDDKLFFRSQSFPGIGQELWYLNTDTDVILLTEDLVPGNGGSAPAYLQVFDNQLYFQATTEAYGAELWSYDPETETLDLRADIRTGSFSARPSYLTAFNDKLYFAANNGPQGTEIWSYQLNPPQPIVFDLGEECSGQDSTVKVPVRVERFEGVNAFQFSLHVTNPSVATLTGITDFALPNGNLFSFGGPETRTVLWEYPDTLGSSLPDSSVLFNVELQLNGLPGQQTSVYIDGDPTPFIVGDPNYQSLPAVAVEGSACILPTVSISGRLYKETGEFVALADVNLTGDEADVYATQASGYYEFVNLPNGGSYTLTPSKDINPANGVNVLDITRIRRHVLGAEAFDSPYQFLAADATNDQSVNVIDISMIRSLILGSISEYPDNTSWRLIPQDFSFPEPQDPFSTFIPENKSYPSLSSDAVDQDFIAVKVGDVTNSADPLNLNAPNPDRNLDTFFFTVNDFQLTPGPNNELILRADSFQNITGFQLTLQHDASQVQIETLQPINLPNFNDSNFHIHAGTNWITLAWTTTDGQPISFPDGTELISIQLNALQSGAWASDLFTVQNFPTPDLAFDLTEEGKPIELHFVPLSTTVGMLDPFLISVQPNPFRASTIIECRSSQTYPVELSILDSRGREAYRAKEIPERGIVRFDITGADLPEPGIYWAQIRHKEGIQTIKLVRQ